MSLRAATHTMPWSMLSKDGITYPPFPPKIHSSTPQDDDATPTLSLTENKPHHLSLPMATRDTMRLLNHQGRLIAEVCNET